MFGAGKVCSVSTGPWAKPGPPRGLAGGGVQMRGCRARGSCLGRVLLRQTQLGDRHGQRYQARGLRDHTTSALSPVDPAGQCQPGSAPQLVPLAGSARDLSVGRAGGAI